MTEEIEDILLLLEDRQLRHSRYYYRPLDPKRSRVIQAYYREQLPAWAKVDGDLDAVLVNSEGTVVCEGYIRIVVGDYGAYIEFDEVQQARGAPLDGWDGEAKANKYVWLRTKDAAQTKVYYQIQRVKYADYKPGCFYVAPSDVRKV